jgi:membrane protein insertase Oxa1/YidC/SpoIIIJ
MAFYEALYRLPAVFEGKFLNLDLGLTPLIALQSGKWYYIIQVVLVFIVTFYSFKLNAGASLGKEQEDQMKMMRNMTLVMIGFASLSVSTAISLYWITNSTFTIVQNLIVKRSKAL